MIRTRGAGLDLSLTCTGIAAPDGKTIAVRTRAKDGDRRLLAIDDEIAWLIATRPNIVAIEDLPTHAYSSGITGMVHGVARRALLRAGIPYVLIVPSVLKKYATGNGNASKTDMAIAALERAGIKFPKDPGGDQCDAWWARAMVLDQYGSPVCKLPAAQRAMLKKVEWPSLEDLGVAA